MAYRADITIFLFMECLACFADKKEMSPKSGGKKEG